MLCLTSVQVVSSAAESLSQGEWDPGMSHVGEQMLGDIIWELYLSLICREGCSA